MTVRAAVLVAPGTVEVRDVERPQLPTDEWAWLRVEACGLCGTDVEQFAGSFTGSGWAPGPMIPGHEVVGVIDEISDATAARWGVAAGDRVAVEPNIPCGSCPPCLTGHYVSCRGWPTRPLAYGFVPMSTEPTLWGGWSEFMALHPLSVIHRVPDALDAGTATLFNALGTAYEWTVRLSGLEAGQSVLILGAGQRGLGGVVSARAAGAGTIIVSGTADDRQRLERAVELGADSTVNVEAEDLVALVHEQTGGHGVDIVVDTSAGAVEPVAQAVAAVADGGTIVLGGLKHGRAAALDVDQVVLRAIRIQGARSAGWPAYHRALEILADRPSLGSMRTHVFGLDDASKAVGVLADGDPSRIYVGVDASA